MKGRDSLGYRLVSRMRAARLDRSDISKAVAVDMQVVNSWATDRTVPVGHYREHLFELLPKLTRELPNLSHDERRHQLYALTSQLSMMEIQALADIARVRFLAKLARPVKEEL